MPCARGITTSTPLGSIWRVCASDRWGKRRLFSRPAVCGPQCHCRHRRRRRRQHFHLLTMYHRSSDPILIYDVKKCLGDVGVVLEWVRRSFFFRADSWEGGGGEGVIVRLIPRLGFGAVEPSYPRVVLQTFLSLLWTDDMPAVELPPANVCGRNGAAPSPPSSRGFAPSICSGLRRCL